MEYEILTPIESTKAACICCGGNKSHLSLDTLLYNGFGGWQVTKNGELFYMAENGDFDNSNTLADIEADAENDPDNDWQACLFSPLRGCTYQRQEGKWVLVDEDEGFA